MTGKLLFATTNAGKLAELRGLLGSSLSVLSLADFPPLPVPAEDAHTFEENARVKALFYARATAVPTLADDSGLCVDALNGAPGVHSARYAPGSDVDRIGKLLGALVGIPIEKRTAAFVCALCLAWPDGRTHIEVGRCDGRISDLPRGDNGFGYDPIFFVPQLGRTAAELSLAEKAQISHRGHAFQRMRPHLLTLFEG